ncbi:chitobiase/beta-hexosaminidase C-terminal domain-containing protein [Parapedobacter tibetensis]|uniref:chitobiase/beta-hexosaminidase C-terminal domain-containing protein n=1 Tax=Parapedobacter tibetensis TaxID=2972951 RepID=UPI00214D6A7D|nr:chitobiase/beta-hexosaminidase C-terminal domain-containing protein [Parapedobacter tibetensis]
MMEVNARGLALATNFSSQDNCEVAYVCDVDSRATDKPQLELIEKGSGKVKIRLSCKTEGTSIAYRTDSMATWSLYIEPFEIPTDTQIHARAIRLGFKESQELVYPR